MSAGHTPGPWVALKHGCSDDFQWLVFAEDGNANEGDSLICEVNPLDGADARLIAAAPELLEALEEARPYVQNVWEAGGDEFTLRKLALIDAAIAKARGEA